MSQDSFSLLSLPIEEELASHISLRRLGDLPVVVVDHPRVRAAVALQGAHLFAWQPAGAEPVLWLSQASAFQHGKAIRGGVPVCWPWFGPAGEPSHGFARISTFELTSSEEDQDEVRLEFALHSDDHTRQLWDHDFTLIVRMRLGATCQITMEAHGDYKSTGALHSYFHIGAIGDVAVSGIGAPYIDQVLDTTGSQDGPLRFPDRIDRVYTAADPVSHIQDPVLHRTIEVRHHDFSDVVTWNPGPELSHTMGDLTDDGYRGFVCVETARISDPMVSTPDRPATLSVTMTVES